MHSFVVKTIVAIPLLALPMLGMAQQEQQACVAASLPAELAGWCAHQPLTAAADTSGLGKATLQIGRSVDATLRSTADVRYVVRPEKPGGSVSYGGMFEFKVEQSGTYRVALSSGAWIDLLKDGKAAQSTAHGRGPDGSSIHKMVDFALTPGRYTLQIAANGEPSVTVMVARLP